MGVLIPRGKEQFCGDFAAIKSGRAQRWMQLHSLAVRQRCDPLPNYFGQLSNEVATE